MKGRIVLCPDPEEDQEEAALAEAPTEEASEAAAEALEEVALEEDREDLTDPMDSVFSACPFSATAVPITAEAVALAACLAC